MSQQLALRMGKQSLLIQRQATTTGWIVQRVVRQRHISCLSVGYQRWSTWRPMVASSESRRTLFCLEGWRAQQPSYAISKPFSHTHPVRWFSEDGSSVDQKSKKDKKKELKQKAKEAAAAAKANEGETEQSGVAETVDTKSEAESPAEDKPPQDQPKQEEKREDDGDEVPDWQNPLHHNNPDMEKIFPEDFGPGEEMPILEAPPLEDPANPEKVLASQELYDLADEIVNLSMLEMTELVNKIGDHFGFEKPPFTGSDGTGGGDDAAEEEGGEGEPVEAAAAKTVFDIKLMSFDDKAKIKVIKEVRAVAGLGLKEAKEMVEGAPGVIMKDIGKDQAEELKKKLEEVGATIEIV